MPRRPLFLIALGAWLTAGRQDMVTAHACGICLPPTISLSDSRRPTNTLLIVHSSDQPPRLRRIEVMGCPGGVRPTTSVPLEPVGMPDFYRPSKPLEVGGYYELTVGSSVVDHFVVHHDLDVTPPAFGGARSVRLYRFKHASYDDAGEPRDIVIEHDPLPREVAFTVVSVRRADGSRPVWRRNAAIGEGTPIGRRDRTVLSSLTCLPDPLPPIEPGATYCVAIEAYDSAGNAAGRDVEVCSRAVQCSDESWTCPSHGHWRVQPRNPRDPEVPLRDMEIPGWMRARSICAALAVLFLLLAWGIRRARHRPVV